MKNTFAKLSTLLLSLIYALSIFIPTLNVSAATESSLETKYPNLEISTIESNDIDYENVIYVNSQEEYDAILQRLNTISEIGIMIPMDVTVNMFYSSKMRVLQMSDISTSPIGFIPAIPPVYMNTQFNFESKYDTVQKAYVFSSISNIQSWLTGIQFPVAYKWTQKVTGYQLTDNNRRATVTVSGVMGTTLIYNQLPQLIEQNATFTTYWTAR